MCIPQGRVNTRPCQYIAMIESGQEGVYLTIMEAIHRVDSLKPNTYSTGQKILWLSQLEATVKRLVLDAHEGDPAGSFSGFTEDTDTETVLYMPIPYDAAYLYWLEAQIHYANEEISLYNNAMEMFNATYRAYKADYCRNHTSRSYGRFRF